MLVTPAPRFINMPSPLLGTPPPALRSPEQADSVQVSKPTVSQMRLAPLFGRADKNNETLNQILARMDAAIATMKATSRTAIELAEKANNAASAIVEKETDRPPKGIEEITEKIEALYELVNETWSACSAAGRSPDSFNKKGADETLRKEAENWISILEEPYTPAQQALVDKLAAFKAAVLETDKAYKTGWSAVDTLNAALKLAFSPVAIGDVLTAYENLETNHLLSGRLYTGRQMDSDRFPIVSEADQLVAIPPERLRWVLGKASIARRFYPMLVLELHERAPAVIPDYKNGQVPHKQSAQKFLRLTTDKDGQLDGGFELIFSADSEMAREVAEKPEWNALKAYSWGWTILKYDAENGMVTLKGYLFTSPELNPKEFQTTNPIIVDRAKALGQRLQEAALTAVREMIGTENEHRVLAGLPARKP